MIVLAAISVAVMVPALIFPAITEFAANFSAVMAPVAIRAVLNVPALMLEALISTAFTCVAVRVPV